MKHQNKEIDIIKLIQIWRDTFESKIEGDDWYYIHINKDRDENRLLENLKSDIYVKGKS